MTYRVSVVPLLSSDSGSGNNVISILAPPTALPPTLAFIIVRTAAGAASFH
jgi:hypothetical protein